MLRSADFYKKKSIQVVLIVLNFATLRIWYKFKYLQINVFVKETVITVVVV